MYHLASLEPPFVSDDMDTLLNAIKYKMPKPLPGVFSVALRDFISKLLSKKMYERPFISEIFSLFPASFKFTSLIDFTNYNKVMKSDDQEFKKNIVDKGLQEIDNEFIALKNRQILSKMNFKSSVKKRKKESSNILAKVFSKTAKKREGNVNLKNSLVIPIQISAKNKRTAHKNLSILQNRITVHNDNDCENVSKRNESIFIKAPVEVKQMSGRFYISIATE
jgi:hypothetical protein